MLGPSSYHLQARLSKAPWARIDHHLRFCHVPNHNRKSPLANRAIAHNDLDIKGHHNLWSGASSTCVSLPTGAAPDMPQENSQANRCSQSANSCYSAQEHSALQSLRATSAALSSTPASTSLPIDISIETIVGLFVTVLGLVAGTPNLRPIQWRVWAGKVEREGEQGFLRSNGEVEKDFVGNPFRVLETRPGFVDIRTQRKEFAEWVRAGGKQ